MWEKKKCASKYKVSHGKQEIEIFTKSHGLGVFRTLMNASDIRLKCHV